MKNPQLRVQKRQEKKISKGCKIGNANGMADENASKSAGNADFVQTAYKANVMLRKQLWQLQPFQ